MRRETKVWLAEYTPLAAIPPTQRTDEQRLRLLAQRLAQRPALKTLLRLEPELAEKLRPLLDFLREEDGSVRIRLVTEDLHGYVDVEIKPQDLTAMLLTEEIIRCRYRPGVVAMEGSG